MSSMSEQAKHTVDALSVGTVLLSLSQWLPPIAALISIIWGLIRIYEPRRSRTCWAGKSIRRVRAMTKTRVLVAALSLSAAAFGGIVKMENWAPVAVLTTTRKAAVMARSELFGVRVDRSHQLTLALHTNVSITHR